MERNKDQDQQHKRGFAAGIAVACSTMFGAWGEEVAVREILGGANLTTRAKMKALGVDDYDTVLCATRGLDVDEMLNTELRRVLAKDTSHFAARNQEKIDLGMKA